MVDRMKGFAATCICVTLAAAGPAGGQAQQSAQPPPAPISLTESPARARPPVWSIDVLDAFFMDAREALVGARPDYRTQNRIAERAGDARRADSLKPPATSRAWSKLIDAETIETEIKRVAQSLADDVGTPSQFKGGGYRACQRHFSLLATLLAVTAEFDTPARWQDIAPGLREAFARAGYNTKVGSDQTYNEAVRRKQDLEELIRGARPQVSDAKRTATWGQVAQRPPLMQRLNAAHEERLTKWLANSGEFSSHRDEVRHEAQVIAMLADVISREGFDYWDDAEYASFARELRDAAGGISAAADLNDFEKARQAIDRAGKACAGCHEAYRG
jgi:hypothetical protein